MWIGGRVAVGSEKATPSSGVLHRFFGSVWQFTIKWIFERRSVIRNADVIAAGTKVAQYWNALLRMWWG